MEDDLKEVYRFIVREGVVTARVIAERFYCSENTAKKKLDALATENYIKTQMVQNPATGKWKKTYRSPGFDDE
jgi:predicted ArsR family transcriptional regulator